MKRNCSLTCANTSKKGRQEDRKTDGGGDGWERGGRDGAGTSPAGALAHLPCCHTNGDTIRVGLKDGGGRLGFFFPVGEEW